MNGDDMKNMEDMLRRHLGVLSEDFQHKLSVVAEGQQMLVERIDRMEQGMNTRMDGLDRNIIKVDVKISAVEERLNKKIDAVAADLAAHRADTESHGKTYRVSE